MLMKILVCHYSREGKNAKQKRKFEYSELQPKIWHAFITLTKVILGIFWAILESDTWELLQKLVELTWNDPSEKVHHLYLPVNLYYSNTEGGSKRWTFQKRWTSADNRRSIVTLPSVLSAVCIAQNLYLADSLPIV